MAYPRSSTVRGDASSTPLPVSRARARSRSRPIVTRVSAAQRAWPARTLQAPTLRHRASTTDSPASSARITGSPASSARITDTDVVDAPVSVSSAGVAPSVGVAPAGEASSIDHLSAALLGAIAGAVDAVGWVALAGLLPSHLTASLVMLGAHAAHDSSEVTARVAMVPVFVLTVALIKGFARWLAARGLPVLPILLTTLTLSLAIFCVVGALSDALLADDPRLLFSVGGVGVASMAVQNTIMRLCLPKHSPTTVMTGNLTQFVMACVDLLARPLSRGDRATPPLAASGPYAPQASDVRGRLQGAGMPLLGFVLGSIVAGYLASQHGLLSLTLPLALAAAITVRSWRPVRPRAHQRLEKSARSRDSAHEPALSFGIALSPN